MKKISKSYIILAIVFLIIIIVNTAAWLSNSFSDFYVTYIYPVFMNFFSFITGVFPFSTGEILIIIGVMLTLVGIPLFIFLLIIKNGKRRKVVKIYSLIILWIMAFILSTETFNCFIMYHCTPFSEKYFKSSDHQKEDLIDLYSLLIVNANFLAEKVDRDNEGYFILTGNTYENAKNSMKKISVMYPQLGGYYPDPKPIMSSYFMSQQNLLGIFFPFTLEANYNKDMCDSNLPSTLCHELAHLKGYIQEDEAGFISFIACINSDSLEFQYSGYLDALEYVHNQISKNNITSDKIISELVWRDLYRFLPENYWNENQHKEIISTEIVSKASDTAMETSLKLNGVEDGKQSYSRMVNLLLDYYKNEES